MVEYRRDHTHGGTYFFTLALKNRQTSLLTQYIDSLGVAFRRARQKAPFQTHAIVVLPEHLHAIWELPHETDDFSLRWRLIKTYFTQQLIQQNVRLYKNKRGEFPLWQRRFWEHRIRDDNDFNNHINYIHANPVKHGLINDPKKWPYSSIHRYIKTNCLPQNWGEHLTTKNQEFGEPTFS